MTVYMKVQSPAITLLIPSLWVVTILLFIKQNDAACVFDNIKIILGVLEQSSGFSQKKPAIFGIMSWGVIE